MRFKSLIKVAKIIKQKKFHQIQNNYKPQRVGAVQPVNENEL